MGTRRRQSSSGQWSWPRTSPHWRRRGVHVAVRLARPDGRDYVGECPTGTACPTGPITLAEVSVPATVPERGTPSYGP